MPASVIDGGQIMVQRNEKGHFLPGVSGNPTGRPKVVGYVRDLARHKTEEAIATLVDIMQDVDASPAARVAAARELLDRGWGKPALPIGGAEDLPPIRSVRELTEAELMAIAHGLEEAKTDDVE